VTERRALAAVQQDRKSRVRLPGTVVSLTRALSKWAIGRERSPNKMKYLRRLAGILTSQDSRLTCQRPENRSGRKPSNLTGCWRRSAETRACSECSRCKKQNTTSTSRRPQTQRTATLAAACQVCSALAASTLCQQVYQT
jgi:hypothetical protein